MHEEILYWEPQIELIDPKDLQKLQLKRLKRQIRYVYERSAFYRRKFDEKGVKPADLKTLKDLEKFPFTTKEDLRQYGYPYGGDFLCVPREQLICWHMTSGTTGKPTVMPYTFKDYEDWMHMMARYYVCAGVKKGDIILNNYGYGLFTGGIGFHGSAFLVGAAVIPWSIGRTEAMVDALKDYKATCITGTPSYAYYISQVIRKMGYDAEKDFNLRLSLNGAEMWTEDMRKRIEDGLALKAHGGGARGCYGATELTGPGAAGECPYEQGYHYWTDHWYLEIINPETGEALEPGEEGEMVFTHLIREAMPLVRYRMRDILKLITDPCECGRKAFWRFDRIRGRTDDVIHFKGSKVWPSAVEESLMKFPQAVEYQIIVDKTVMPYDMMIKVEVPSSEVTPDLKAKIEAELARNLFARPAVEIVDVGTLPRFEGKAKRIVYKE